MNTIALSKINLKAPTQLRSSGEDMSHVKDLAHSYADTGSFKELPWVALIKETNEYVPIDGFHRLTALQWLSEQEDIKCQLDLENVRVRLTEFETLSDAIVAAAGVNANHGLKRKKGDIQSAINKLLEVERIRFMKTPHQLNKKAIMEAVGCSESTYRKVTQTIRSELEETRNSSVFELSKKGLTQREIAQRIMCDQKTVGNILNEEKRHSAKIPQTSSGETSQADTLDGITHEKHSESKQGQSVSAEGLDVSNDQSSQALQSTSNNSKGEEKRHDDSFPQVHIQKRKANLIESITRQLKFLSVEQLKNVDGHIATVSDF